MWARHPDLSPWQQVVERFTQPQNGAVRIGVVGKYVHLRDSYKSLHEALVHGGMANNVSVDLTYIDSEDIEKQGAEALLGCRCCVGARWLVIVAPRARSKRFATFARRPAVWHLPGMRLRSSTRAMCARWRAPTAPSSTRTPICRIDLMHDQRSTTQKAARCVWRISVRSAERYQAAQAYGRPRSVRAPPLSSLRGFKPAPRRHRRIGSGLLGPSPDKRLVEMIELPDHPYFVGCQFHPEFKSRPMAAHPLFSRFVKAALEHRNKR
ncbi:MAG: hypothetical protein U0165_19405 [Polyangiaceae bacterium]